MILSRLMNRIRGRIAALFAVVALSAIHEEGSIRQQIVANVE
jgi:hypothetical protein